MHKIILEELDKLTLKADVIEEGFIKKSEVVRQCSADSGKTIEEVNKALSKVIESGKIEQKQYFSDGVKGFRKGEFYIKEVSKKEEVKK